MAYDFVLLWTRLTQWSSSNKQTNAERCFAHFFSNQFIIARHLSSYYSKMSCDQILQIELIKGRKAASNEKFSLIPYESYVYKLGIYAHSDTTLPKVPKKKDFPFVILNDYVRSNCHPKRLLMWQNIATILMWKQLKCLAFCAVGFRWFLIHFICSSDYLQCYCVPFQAKNQN